MPSNIRRAASPLHLPGLHLRGLALAAFALAMLVGAPQVRATPQEAPAAVARPVEVRMDTPLGHITLWLDPARAPLTVANFLRYVDEGKLDESTFYRTVRLDNQGPHEVPIQVVQGGLLGRIPADGTMDKPDGFAPIAHEPTSRTGLRHVPGAISMARAQPGTATSEFFISLVDSPALDAGGARNPDGLGFAVFGHVVEGMDVLQRIHGASAAASGTREELGVMRGQLLDEPVRICSVARVATSGHESAAPATGRCAARP